MTAKEWIAALADIRGGSLRFGATAQDRIKPLPTPGQVVAQNLLASGPYADLAPLLWQHWKFLCDPAHAGLSVTTLRHALREELLGRLDEPVRAQMVYQEVVARSLVPSLVAITTLTTVFASRHMDDAELMAAVTSAWDLLEKGTLEGGIIWDRWAKRTLGVLE